MRATFTTSGAKAGLTDKMDKAFTTPEESQSRYAEIFTDLKSELSGYFDEAKLDGLEEQFLEDLGEHEGEKAISKAIKLDIVRLLVEVGEDLNEINDEMRAALTGLELEGGRVCSREEYEQGKRRRFGTSNPEVMDIAFWQAMVHSGATTWKARSAFEDTESAETEETMDEAPFEEKKETRVESGQCGALKRGRRAGNRPGASIALANSFPSCLIAASSKSVANTKTGTTPTSASRTRSSCTMATVGLASLATLSRSFHRRTATQLP